MTIRTVIAGIALTAGVTAALAQVDVIAERKGIMKGVGGATRTATQMVRGEAAFDAVKAKEIFATYEDAARRMPLLFPNTSRSGGETSASANVWDDAAGFKAAFAKFEAEAKQASLSAKDVATFRTAFGEVTKNCGTCHQTYRILKN